MNRIKILLFTLLALFSAQVSDLCATQNALDDVYDVDISWNDEEIFFFIELSKGWEYDPSNSECVQRDRIANSITFRPMKGYTITTEGGYILKEIELTVMIVNHKNAKTASYVLFSDSLYELVTNDPSKEKFKTDRSFWDINLRSELPAVDLEERGTFCTDAENGQLSAFLYKVKRSRSAIW